MAFLKIRIPAAIRVVFIALGLPASGAFLLFGLDCLSQPFNSDGGVVAGLMFCSMGVFLLLMAITTFWGILHRNKSSTGEHEK